MKINNTLLRHMAAALATLVVVAPLTPSKRQNIEGNALAKATSLQPRSMQ
ncbi:MAG TPA: hypothetical protein VFQ83_00590 [Candidatus Udaeobacter sp.]|nr:hypothetical protein [Candidatus Udaeobacter sp.]